MPYGNAGGGGNGSGSVTTVSVATSNGFSGTVSNATTTPAITLKTSVNGILKGVSSTGVVSAAVYADLPSPTAGSISNAMLANGAVANLSGTNTGDQTNITGNAATVTTNANLTGDVTSTGNATTVAKIQTVTVSGVTGTGNVVFSAAPTLTGVANASTIVATTVQCNNLNNSNGSITMLQGVASSVSATYMVGATNPLLRFGGTTSSFPAIKRSTTALNFRLADDSADCGITCSTLTTSSDTSISGNTTLTGTLSAGGAASFNANGTASVSSCTVTGTQFLGTGTTSTPILYINNSSAPTSWNAIANGGTCLGINAASGFLGNFLDLRKGGGSNLFYIDASGNVGATQGIFAGQLSTGNNLISAGQVRTSYAGGASTYTLGTTGGPYAPASGGTGTNMFPQWYSTWGSATAQTSWNSTATTGGTVNGILAPSTFTGMFADWRLGTSATATPAFSVSAAGAVTAGSTLSTAAPSGGVSALATWQLGSAVTTSGLVPSTTVYIEVNIGGTLRKLVTA